MLSTLAPTIRPASRSETICQPNCGAPADRTIGWFIQPDAAVIRQDRGVTAAWWSDVRVQPGTYEVTSNGYYAWVRIPGVIVSAYSAPLFAGMPIGSGQPQYDEHPDVGSKTTIVSQPYLFQVAAWMADPASEWCPESGVEVVLTGWNGHHPTFGLVDHR